MTSIPDKVYGQAFTMNDVINFSVTLCLSVFLQRNAFGNGI